MFTSFDTLEELREAVSKIDFCWYIEDLDTDNVWGLERRGNWYRLEKSDDGTKYELWSFPENPSYDKRPYDFFEVTEKEFWARVLE